MENFKPLSNRVLVKRIVKDNKTASGIYLSEEKSKDPCGTVINVGPGKRDANGNLIPMSVKVGDQVWFSKYAAVDLSNDQYLVVSEDEVLGIL